MRIEIAADAMRNVATSGEPFPAEGASVQASRHGATAHNRLASAEAAHHAATSHDRPAALATPASASARLYGRYGAEGRKGHDTRDEDGL